MNDAWERQRVRRFIARWAGNHPVSSVAEIQAAALAHFAPDVNFVKGFLPIAIGCDREGTRALMQAPLAEAVWRELRALDAGGESRFMFEGEQWIRRPEWRRPLDSE